MARSIASARPWTTDGRRVGGGNRATAAPYHPTLTQDDVIGLTRVLSHPTGSVLRALSRPGPIHADLTCQKVDKSDEATSAS